MEKNEENKNIEIINTFKKLCEIQSLLKKESSLRILCK